MTKNHRNVAVLALAQALFLTGVIVQITIASLAGDMLAPAKALATLPITATVLAMTLTTIPASLLMKRHGRRAGFMGGAVFGLIACAVGAYAIYIRNFTLFNIGASLFGIYAGTAFFYRFAAADAAEEKFKPKAISLVLSGGVIAALATPELVRQTTYLIEGSPYLGSYMVIAAFPVAALALLAFIDIPDLSEEEIKDPGRPLGEIARNPVFIFSVLGGAMSYGVMSLVMTATPLSMIGAGFKVGEAAFVIQGHMLAMYAPSFVTGRLITRFGAVTMVLTGIALLALSSVIAFQGVGLTYYWVSLVTLGLGWNFAFTAATDLLTETYSPSERAKVQGFNDFLVFGTMVLATLSSGILLNYSDWTGVNASGLTLVALTAAVMARLRPATGTAKETI